MQVIWLIVFALIVFSNSVCAATNFDGVTRAAAPIVQSDEQTILLVQKQTTQPVYQAPPPPKPVYQAPPPPVKQIVVPQQTQPAKLPQTATKQPSISTAAKIAPPKSAATAPAYTFSPTGSGTVQVFQNGQLITTSTPQFAAQQFGYQLPGSTATTKPNPVTSVKPTAIKPTTTTFIQSGTGAQLTAAQISAGSFPANTFFIESGTGRQLTAQQVKGNLKAPVGVQTTPKLTTSPVPPTQPSTVTTPKQTIVGAKTTPQPQLTPGWQDRLPQYAYGTPGNPAPRNPLGPNGTATITQTYGQPWVNNPKELHTGIDISANKGAPVAATAGGIVTVGWLGCVDKNKSTPAQCPGINENYGNYVVVKKSDGSAEGYLHVNTQLKTGDTVKTGNIVGSIYDNHLHYNECKEAKGCQHGAVTPDEFSKGNYLKPKVNN
jgi:murein DD-endopeptidase MepM/ murein hydrolase activator NlpD